MNLIRYYPSGVVCKTGSKFSKFLSDYHIPYIQEPDAVINTYYKEVATKTVNGSGLSFQLNVIEYVISKFGESFLAWVKYQLEYGLHLTRNNREFLIDTHNYVVTGNRSVSLGTWQAIYDYYPDRSTTNRDLSDKLVSKVTDYDYRYIQYWLSRPGGFYDMLVTCHMLFGRSN